jgi:hypothetical protein
MPRLPQQRVGERLRIKERPLEFAFWPVEKTNRRFGLGSRVFATDPWTVIRRSAETRCLPRTRAAAFALLEQAQDFFEAAESGVKAAKPLLLYYCFMNLGKAFILTTQQREQVDNAHHGLAERLDVAGGGSHELIDAYLEAKLTSPPGPIPDRPIQLFDELLHALTGAGIPAHNHRYCLPSLLPQVVPGHRLWVEGTGRAENERFIAIEEIEFRYCPTSKMLWMQLNIFRDDLVRINLTHNDLLSNARISGTFRQIGATIMRNEREVLCFEQIAPIQYSSIPSDYIDGLVAPLRPLLWRTVLSQRPYRQYYLYPAPPAEHDQILPQVLSIYAITFYLGSIVRYRPHHFDEILKGDFGPFIEAFLNDQPNQFLYLMASEFALREVTKAAIV